MLYGRNKSIATDWGCQSLAALAHKCRVRRGTQLGSRKPYASMSASISEAIRRPKRARRSNSLVGRWKMRIS